MVGIVDYGSGNLRSVSNALLHEGAQVRLVRSPAEMEGLTSLVLPGVGAFGDCARQLKERRLWDCLHDWLNGERPFLGICLGYQVLFESSEESPGEAGLGFFKGTVRRFTPNGLKVPHMGWNTLEIMNPPHPLWRGLPVDPYVFFVHSYFPVPEDPGVVTSNATYGEKFAASAARGNVAAMQFHPEKSQATGLAILRNFVNAQRSTGFER